MKLLRIASACFAPGLYVVFSSVAFSQGSLSPPGPPAPLMKSLDQIDQHVASVGERRIDALTVGGSNKDLHLITVPGSYYLSANVAGVAGKSGLESRCRTSPSI